MNFKIQKFETLSSTQNKAKALFEAAGQQSLGIVIVAEEQTAGRGRLGREWASSKGGLYFSVVLSPPTPLQVLPLIAAVATAEGLENLFGLRLHVKWPNDLLLGGQKIAGILCEYFSLDTPCVILGIGVNLNQPKERLPPWQQQGATSFFEKTHQVYDLDKVLNSILESLDKTLELFASEGFEPIRTRWMERAYQLGEQIEFCENPYVGTPPKIGIFEGIDVEGALVLKDSEGKSLNFKSGEIIVAGH